MTEAIAAGAAYEPTQKEIRMVIAASSAGTVFEWYDFYLYRPAGDRYRPVQFFSLASTRPLGSPSR